MPITEMDGFESGRTDQATSVVSAAGSPANVISPAYKSSTRSINFFGTAISSMTYGFLRGANGAPATGGAFSRVRMLLRVIFSAFPSPVAPEFAIVDFPGLSCRILPQNTGAIAIGTNNASKTISSVTLTTATWYVFDILVDNPGLNYVLKIYNQDMTALLDTVTFAPASSVLTGNSVSIGKLIAVNGPPVFYFDAILIDSSTPLTPIVVGDWEVVRKNAISNGTDTGWTGSFADIDEIPTSDTGDNINTQTVNAASTFGLQTNAAVGIVGTPLAVKVTNNLAQDAVESTVNAIRLRQGAAVQDSPSMVLTGTAAQRLSLVYAVDPTDAAAWTLAKINSMQPGVANGGARAQPVRNYNMVTQIAVNQSLIPPPPSGSAKQAKIFMVMG